MLLIVICWSYCRKLLCRSSSAGLASLPAPMGESSFARHFSASPDPCVPKIGTSVAIRWLPDFDEYVHPGRLVSHGKLSRPRLLRLQRGKLRLVPADQVPFKDQFHRVSKRLRSIDIGGDQ